MSMQVDLRHPELGYRDEGMNLTDASVYEQASRPFGEATMLPPVAYRSKAFFELENEKMWTRSWVQIGLLAQIPEPGDLLPFTLGFHGLHVQRNADGTASARMNRHQHGGCRFVPTQCRTGAQTKCSITSCNYTRDADVMPGGSDGENTDLMYKFVGLVPERLTPVRFETMGQFIFVNLDPEAGPLDESMGALPTALGASAFQPFALAGKKWLDFRCNWKLAGDAFTAASGKGNAQRSGPPDAIWAGPASFDAIEPGGTLLWLFPNLLVAQGDDYMAVALLQATDMGRCLCRSFLLARPDADAATCERRFAAWAAFLQQAATSAECKHRDIVALGTSLSPGTGASDMPVESTPASHALNSFLADRLQREHRYYWNAPIMDASMTMRGSR